MAGSVKETNTGTGVNETRDASRIDVCSLWCAMDSTDAVDITSEADC